MRAYFLRGELLSEGHGIRKVLNSTIHMYDTTTADLFLVASQTSCPLFFPRLFRSRYVPLHAGILNEKAQYVDSWHPKALRHPTVRYGVVRHDRKVTSSQRYE